MFWTSLIVEKIGKERKKINKIKRKEAYSESSKVIISRSLSPMLLTQELRDKFNSSIHANDNDTKRDKLKLCLRMLMLQGNFSSGICSESYKFYQKDTVQQKFIFFVVI